MLYNIIDTKINGTPVAVTVVDLLSVMSVITVDMIICKNFATVCTRIVLTHL